ncbi:MAG: NADP-dependent oxidoreductase [Pseudomonadota bacterium]
MQAAVYRSYGAPSVIALEELETPQPKPGECLVKVAGAGLNPVDAKLRSGSLEGLFPLTFPVIPGWDVSGTVDAVGSDADAQWLGKSVFAYVRFDGVGLNGSAAQYCIVPTSFLAQVPASIDLADSASVPLAALTAYQSLVEEAAVKAGDSVLILAGGGAVGHWAIQIAASVGAHIVTTASPRHHEALKEKGARDCVNYREADWPDQAKALMPEGYDVILDGVGAETLEAAYPLLKAGGCIVGLNDVPDPEKVPAGSKAVRLFSRPEGTQLAQISTWIDEGSMALDTVEVLPLSAAAEGHAALDKGSPHKIVLAP